MMRAVRFSAQLGYEIEAETADAIRVLAPNLKNISAERIQTELVKLVTSPHPDDLRIAYETGITKVILPEFDICMTTNQNHPHHCYTVGEHILHSMCEIRPDKVLRLAMLFHDIGKPDAITTDEHGINHFHGHPEISAAYAQKIKLCFAQPTPPTLACIFMKNNIKEQSDYDHFPFPAWECQLY